MNSLFWLLVRNTLASWIINIEFIGPLIIWFVAIQKKDRWPSLSRQIWLPICLWLLAGLIKQASSQFLSPYSLIRGDLTLADTSYLIYLWLYFLLNLASGILLIRLVYLKRRTHG